MLDALQHSSCTCGGHLRVTRAHANKIFGFSSISWHFLRDFVCPRKAFQYALKIGSVVLTLVCKASSIKVVPFGHSKYMLDHVHLMLGFPYLFSKECWNPILLPLLSVLFLGVGVLNIFLRNVILFFLIKNTMLNTKFTELFQKML